MNKFCIFIICIISIFFSCNTTFANNSDGEFTCKDYCGIISDKAKTYINSQNEILFDEIEAKIIFITTNSTDNLSVQEYCKKYYKESSFDKYGRNNSILCIISPAQNDYGFTQGQNISLTLTDEMIDDFIVKYFEPDFKNKNYDEAILKIYNAFALWYLNEYNNLNLTINDNISLYTGGEATPDIMEKPSHIWIWICTIFGLIITIIVLKIKRNIELQIRQHERRRLKKKFKIDIDKIANS